MTCLGRAEIPSEVLSTPHGTEPTTVLKAEFKHDIQVKISEFGPELEFFSGGRRMIWFKKTD